MSATPAFISKWRSGIRSIVVLVEMDVRVPSSLAVTTMRFASAETSTPYGLTSGAPVNYWPQQVIEFQPVQAPGTFADTGVALCSCSIVLQPGAVPNNMLLDGAAVRIYLWDTRLTDWDDALMVFAGVVIRVASNATAVTLDLRQRTNWNRDIVPMEVTPEAYPHAPDESIGQSVPVVYGAMRDIPLRAPWAEYPSTVDTITPAPTGTPSKGASVVLGGRRVGSAILVDTGRGAGAYYNPKARVLVASHKCKTVSDATRGVGAFLSVNGKNWYVEPADAVNDVFNTTAGAGILLPDNGDVVWATAFPSDFELVTNTCENPRAVLTQAQETNYARFDWTAGLKTLRLKLTDLPPDTGEMTDAYLFVGYRSDANTNFKVLLRPNGSLTGAIGVNLDARATRSILLVKYTGLGGWAAPFNPAAPWSFAGVTLECGWPTYGTPVTGTGTGEIYFVGLAFKFKPRQDVIQSDRFIDHTATVPRMQHGKVVWMPYTSRDIAPATTELKGKFFANVEGYADDGQFETAGAFTGTANALIERAPDMLAHMLRVYGLESLANIERGVGGFGSFVDARALLKSPRKTDMVYALSIGQTADVMTAIAWVTQGSASRLILDRFADRWRLLPWRTDLPVDYEWLFTPADMVDGSLATVERTPLSNIVTGIQLGYGNDASSSQSLHTTRLAWNGSNAGYKYRGIRDESLTVVAGINDRLDFILGAVASASLTPGSYSDPAAFGKMVSDRMLAANGSQPVAVTWGCAIIAGYNDALAYRDNTSGFERSYIVPAGNYASFDDLCIAIGNANGNALLASYSRTTRKVTFFPGFFPVTLRNATGSAAARAFYATIGFGGAADISVPGATTAQYERAEETFALTAMNATYYLSLLWETGTNGLNGTRTNCSSLLGFSGLRDSATANTRQYLADGPKNVREAALLATAQRYGARRDTVEELRAVIDTDTAREVRNRVADLIGKPRTIVTFTTDMAPDLERGRVIQFSAAFDGLLPFPDPDSDRTWAGKRFVVVETEQQLGPVAFYVKVVAVGLD